jgi:glutamate synthase (NADPH/NADH) large chain
VGRSRRHRAHRRPLCLLHLGSQWPAPGALGHHQEPHITIASETGVWDYAPEDVVRKGKLGPGDMIALDLQTGELLESPSGSTIC